MSWNFSDRPIPGKNGPVDPELPGAVGPSLSTASAASFLRQPPTVPDYELLRCIGRGSYGDVWLAHNVLGELRAVKFVYRDRFADPRPFDREFEGIQRFEPISRSHPSQLHILHVGKNDAAGCFYYVMELADDARPTAVGTPFATPDIPSPGGEGQGEGGSTIANEITGDVKIVPANPLNYVPRTLRSDLERHNSLPIPDCVQVGLSLATALQHLHDQGLVHRDIKPSNVIFVNGVAKLGDIGLVTDAGDTQSIVGTEGYLPPEGPGTPQADLYSLGKVLYEISTGLDRRRFAELPEEIWTWPDQKAVVEFNEIVLKACAKNPTRRYSSATALRADLELLQAGKSVKRARASQQAWRWAQKAVTLVLLCLTASGVAYLVRQAQRRETSADGPASTNELANALCDKALVNLRGDNQRGFPEVYTNLHRAIALDLNFAKPYVGLLELHSREALPGVSFPPSENLRTVVERLVELAPDSPAAHCGQSMLNFYDWDYPAAERHSRRGIALGPGYELGHSWYGFMLAHWGRAEEGRKELEIARRLNSFKVQNHRVIGHTYFAQRDFSHAIEVYREALAWEPHDGPAYLFTAYAYRAMGDYPKAIDAFEELERNYNGGKAEAGERAERLRQALARDGARGYWEEEWKLAPTNRFYFRAVIQRHLGDTNAAFQWLDRCYATHERDWGDVQDWMYMLLIDPTWDELRDDPRFKQLLDKIGFTKVMPKPQ